MSDDFDLFEFLRYILDCEYISDLKIEPYNSKAKLLLNKLDLSHYLSNQLVDIYNYIYN